MENNKFEAEMERNNINDSNKQKNKERLFFFQFLMYNTKIEMHYSDFHSMIYWICFLEIALFIIVLGLLISSPSHLSFNFIFIIHLIKSVIGGFLLRNLPNTYTVIENLSNYESSSLEDIQIKMYHEFKILLQSNEKKLKILLFLYFLFTIICMIVDIIVFAVVLSNWSNESFEYGKLVNLLAIFCYFSMNFNK